MVGYGWVVLGGLMLSHHIRSIHRYLVRPGSYDRSLDPARASGLQNGPVGSQGHEETSKVLFSCRKTWPK